MSLVNKEKNTNIGENEDIETIDADNSKLINKKIKEIVCTRNGLPEYLQLKELEKPVLKDNEVLCIFLPVNCSSLPEGNML